MGQELGRVAAHGFHIGRAAGGGHEGVASFHAFHEFRGLTLRGDVGAQGHFHDVAKAQTAQGGNHFALDVGADGHTEGLAQGDGAGP